MSGVIGHVGPREEFPVLASCFASVPDGASLATDSLGVPASGVDPVNSFNQRKSNSIWVPEGFHVGLHFEHDHRVTTGPFVDGEWGWCWHITVSDYWTVDSMRNELHNKSAEVQFVIGGRKGVENPVCIQCLPLNEYGKGLIHLSGQPDTNRKPLIQVEICATVKEIASFKHYQALANLFWICTHGTNPRVPVHNKLARSFENNKRFTSTGYKRVRGHHGHMHVPQNDHVDPTNKFKGATLVRLCSTAPHSI